MITMFWKRFVPIAKITFMKLRKKVKKIIIKKLSSKQKALLKWCHKPDGFDNIICDGAVRSGKTAVMSISFIHWAMRYFNGKNFALISKTHRQAERNIVLPLLSCPDVTDYFKFEYQRSNGLLKVSSNKTANNFYLFGGKDEGSYSLIQGTTLTGVLFDEVALMPKSFVEQAIARTLSEKGAKLWFNCNPENPNHWFYKEWILDAQNENKKNSLYLHFLMDDNPIVTTEQKQKAKSLYSGVFYDRYILGKWVRAEGRIYDDITPLIVDKFKANKERLIIGIDFGGNKSKTTFVATLIMKDFSGLYVLADHKLSGKKGEIDIERISNELSLFIDKIKTKFGFYPDEIRADSAEQYLINSLRKSIYKNGITVPVKDSDKAKILDRIRCTDSLIKAKKLFINKSCKHLIMGLENAVWDQKAAEKGIDMRLDDFTSDIDILDAFEYSFSPYLRNLTPQIFKPIKDRGGIIRSDDFLGGWN